MTKDTDSKRELDSRAQFFEPLNGLPDGERMRLLDRAEVISCGAGDTVFEQGDEDRWAFFLLDGELQLLNDDRLVSTVSGGSQSARTALSQLQPRQLTARASAASHLLRVDRDLMQELHTHPGRGQPGHDGRVESDWMSRLLNSQLFMEMPAGALQELFACLEAVELKAGEVVVKQDSPGDFFFVIGEGRCEVVREAARGCRVTPLAELGPGATFGEEALVSNARRNATVRMVTDGSLMRMSKQDFCRLVSEPLIKRIDADDARQRVAGGGCWLDVRFLDEHQQGTIRGARLLPMARIREESKSLRPDIEYVTFCDTGARAAVASFLLLQRGIRVSVLRGGLEANPNLVGEGAETPQVEGLDLEPDLSSMQTTPAVLATDTPQPPLPATVAGSQPVSGQFSEEDFLQEIELLRGQLASVEAERSREKQRLAALQRDAAREIDAERKRLEASLKREIEVRRRTEREKAAVEQALADERNQLKRAAEEAAARLREARDVAAQLARVQREQAETAGRHQQEIDRLRGTLQAEFSEQLSAERSKLQSMLEGKEAQLAEARSLQQAAEAASREAQDEAERQVREYEEAYNTLRNEELEGLRVRREELEAELAQTQARLEEAEQARCMADSARTEAEREIAALRADGAAAADRLQSVQSRLQAAQRSIDEANLVASEAESEKERLDDALQAQADAEINLSGRLRQEVEQWRAEEESRESSPAQQALLLNQRKILEEIKSRAQDAKQERQSHDRTLLDEVQRLLQDGEDA